MDWEPGFITLDSERTKSGYAREPFPILEGDMMDLLKGSHENADGCGRASSRGSSF